MNVITTHTPCWPVRALRWVGLTLAMFWDGFDDYLRSEYEAWRARK